MESKQQLPDGHRRFTLFGFWRKRPKLTRVAIVTWLVGAGILGALWVYIGVYIVISELRDAGW